MSLIPLLFGALLAFWAIRAILRHRQREEELAQRLADRDPRRIKLGRSSANARAFAAPHLFVDPSESLSGHNPLDLSSTFDSGSSSGGSDCYAPSSSDNNCGDGNNQSAGDCGNWGDNGFSGGADSGFPGTSDCGSSS